MPYSSEQGKNYTHDILTRIQPKKVIDVGAGAGVYRDIVKAACPDAHITAVEIWEPYISKFNLNERYDEVVWGDARHLDNLECDLIIFGDVLEHMSKEDSIALWEKASKQARYGLISIPTIHYPQGEYEGNPYEAHVEDDWSVSDVLECFSFIVEHEEYEVVSVFLADFGEKD